MIIKTKNHLHWLTLVCVYDNITRFAGTAKIKSCTYLLLKGNQSVMYAVIKTGGKQYTVRENEIVLIEKLDIPIGDEVALTDILLVQGDKGTVVGTPIVDGAKVTGKVVRHGLSQKVVGFTYKAKKNVRGRYGHRQPFTQVLIEKISY